MSDLPPEGSTWSEPANAGGWTPDSGRVTRAFDDWRLAERGLRAFLRLGLEFSEESYEARWQRLSRMPANEDGPELIDLMDEEVDGLNSIDFEWLLMNLVVRDAVTLYEVYLEKALHEVASFRVHETTVGETSPRWDRLAKVYRKVFNLEVEPPEVAAVIALRHLLTHRRGELHTDRLRERYDTKEYHFPDIWVRLRPEEVLGHLDTLATSIARVDAVMYPFAWGDAPFGRDKHDELLIAAPWLF